MPRPGWIPGEDAFKGEHRRLLAHLLPWETHFERTLGHPDQAHQRMEAARQYIDQLKHLALDIHRPLALWWQERGGLENNLSFRKDA